MSASDVGYPWFCVSTRDPAATGLSDYSETMRVEWSGACDCLLIELMGGQLFIPREGAQEFLLRVQAAVAVGFPAAEKLDSPAVQATAEVR